MSIISEILSLPQEQIKPLLNNIKKLIKNRNDYFSNLTPANYAEFSRNLKNEKKKCAVLAEAKTFFIARNCLENKGTIRIGYFG